MSQPRPPDQALELTTIAGKLFAPGERLGWTFTDRRRAHRPFSEPKPELKTVPERLQNRRESANPSGAAWRFAMATAVAVLFIGLAWLASWAESTFDWAPAGTASTVLRWCLILPVLVIVISLAQLVLGGQAVYAAGKTKRDNARRHKRELAEWARREEGHAAAERERIEKLPEWTAAATREGARRLDVFGGTLHGWEALLTVHGAATLAARPLIVLDFSRELVCAELAQLAAASGMSVHAQSLPAQLSSSDLGHAMPPRQLTDVLIEAMYGDSPDTMRSERTLDDRILSKLCQALAMKGQGDMRGAGEVGGGVSIARLACALTVMMGETPDTGLLSFEERDRICDEVFTEEYRRQNHAAIARMEAFLHPVRDLGTQPALHRPARLRCVALDPGSGRNVRDELLTDLITQYLTYQLAQTGPDGPAVIVAGADELARRHLERLSDICERRHVPLTLLFRHLREQSLDLVGGGAVAFMRLGNHQEATAAADFIGRGHKFVLSQITKTLGGNETHTTTDTKGGSDARTTGHSTQYEAFGIFPEGSGTQRSRSRARNWSAAKSFADGTNWTNAEASQRVYEYTVEPTTLQHLPDYALLLTETTGAAREPTLTPVECDPSITLLPDVALQPTTHHEITPPLPRHPALHPDAQPVPRTFGGR